MFGFGKKKTARELRKERVTLDCGRATRDLFSEFERELAMLKETSDHRDKAFEDLKEMLKEVRG